jgi:beta-galactosidase
MMTTESMPSAAFDNWKLAHERPYILGEFVWTAMDYLGESGIGNWSEVAPEQASQVTQAVSMMDQMTANMGADGKNPFEMLTQVKPGEPNPAAATMSLMFPGFPWHAAQSGDLDLTGYRKPESYYRDILWNGGDRVFATVRLPEPAGKKIIAIGWAVYPTLPSWTWPGCEGKEMQVEVYAGTERVRLYLDDKLVGEMPTTVEQQRRALFAVPYAPGRLKAVGVNGDREVATSVLETVGDAVKLRLTADRNLLQANGEDLSFVTVEAVDAQGRLQPNAAAEVQFSVGGEGKIVAVGNGDGMSQEPYQGDHRALFQGRALVVIRTSRTAGSIRLSASVPGMTADQIMIRTQPASPGTELQ